MPKSAWCVATEHVVDLPHKKVRGETEAAPQHRNPRVACTGRNDLRVARKRLCPRGERIQTEVNMVGGYLVADKLLDVALERPVEGQNQHAHLRTASP